MKNAHNDNDSYQQRRKIVFNTKMGTMSWYQSQG